MPAAAVDEEEEHDEGHDQGSTPDTVPRHCTDCLFGLLFLACIGGLGYVYNYAYTHGTPEKFAHLPTASGDLCGYTEAVKDKPYLFFCQGDDGKLSYSGAICVSSCEVNSCSDDKQVMPEYTAKPFAGMLCMPDLETSSELAGESMSLVTSKVQYLMDAEGLINAWPILAASAGVAIISAFLFLFCLSKITGCFVWLGFSVLILTSGGFGGTLLFASQQPGGLDGVPSSGDSQQDMAIGGGALAVALIILLIACCKRSAMQRAIECVKSAAECIEENPSLLVEPIFALLLRIIVILVLVVGWVYLLACAKSLSVLDDNGKPTVQVDYTDEEKAYLAFLFLMSLWILEFGNAMSNYVVAYVTENWFFKTGQPCSLMKAYWSGLTYHLGSLALGSFIIALVRGIRIVVSVAEQAMKDTGNPVGRLVACCCNCFMGCFESVLQKLNKFAYMDIAMNSTNFCTAAGHALSILTHNATSAFLLHGATFMFEIAGVGAITAAGGAFTYLCCKNMHQYNDPTQPTYIEDPVFVSCVSAVICFFLALPFMVVFSAAADTVLFCFALERKRTSEEEEESSHHCHCIQSHLLACVKQSPTSKSRPKYDDSRHPEGTRKLLDKAQKK